MSRRYIYFDGTLVSCALPILAICLLQTLDRSIALYWVFPTIVCACILNVTCMICSRKFSEAEPPRQILSDGMKRHRYITLTGMWATLALIFITIPLKYVSGPETAFYWALPILFCAMLLNMAWFIYYNKVLLAEQSRQMANDNSPPS